MGYDNFCFLRSHSVTCINIYYQNGKKKKKKEQRVCKLDEASAYCHSSHTVKHYKWKFHLRQLQQYAVSFSHLNFVRSGVLIIQKWVYKRLRRVLRPTEWLLKILAISLANYFSLLPSVEYLYTVFSWLTFEHRLFHQWANNSYSPQVK